jgi:hypothetical protein
MEEIFGMEEGMTTWLRTTRFTKGLTITVVLPSEDLVADVHVIANDTRRMFGSTVDVEIFKFEGTLEQATLLWKERAEKRIPEKKKFRDALHDFLITMFLKTATKTVITPTNVTPMGAEEILEILIEVMKHPSYKGQIVALRTLEGKGVMLEDNLILVKDSA